MKNKRWLLLALIIILAACSNSGKDASETIQNNVARINAEQEAINKEPDPVETPDIETLKSRAETIMSHFCDEGAKKRAPARFITSTSPERFYLSDSLAGQLNGMSQLLAQGFFITVETIEEPAKGQYGYVEALFHVSVEVGDNVELIIALSYETKYDKFHEKKSWKPQ